MTSFDFFLCGFTSEGKCDGCYHWGWSQIKENHGKQQCLMEVEAYLALKLISNKHSQSYIVS